MSPSRTRNLIVRRGPVVWIGAAAIPVALAAPLCIVCLAASGCSEDAAAPQAPLPPAPVSVARAVRKDLPFEVHGFGYVEALSTVRVKPQVEGIIVEVAFREGQEVAKGDLLVRLDPRLFEAELKKAEGNLARDIARAEQARAEAERMERLYRDNLNSKEEYDLALSNAKAQEAAVQADAAAVDYAKLQVEYTAIRSPVKGFAGARAADVGNVVKANETTLVTILEVEPVHVVFSVAERHLPSIRNSMAGGELKVLVRPEAAVGRPSAAQPPSPAQPSASPTEASRISPAGAGLGSAAPAAAEVGLADAAGSRGGSAWLEGKLFFIDNAVDRTTGMIRLEAVFPNQDRQLWPGQYVAVSMTLETLRDRVVVPSRAVLVSQQGKFVFTVDATKSTVAMKPVEEGPSVGDETVIDCGLEAEEIVVTEGQLRLVPGRAVQIVGGPAADGKAGS